jgi:hypothetical protein
MKSSGALSVAKLLHNNSGVDMLIYFLDFLGCIGLIYLVKELSKLSYHFLQLSNILLYFLNSCIGWLARVGGCADTEFTLKLEADVLQSYNDFAGFFPKYWVMTVIMMFKVVSLIITERGGSLLVLYT